MATANPDSILDSVKKSLGFDPDYDAFDVDITLFINSAFGSLQQLGVGGDTGFTIQDNTTLWSQYVAHLSYLGLVKQYIYLSVKLAFDPPATSFGILAIENMLAQLGWRINVAVEAVDPPSDPFGTEDAVNKYFVVATKTLDFDSVVTPDAGEANTFYLTLTGDCTINAPINGIDGGHVTLELTSAGFNVTWGNGWNFGTSGVPVLTDGKTDIISAIYHQTTAEWYAGLTPGF